MKTIINYQKWKESKNTGTSLLSLFLSGLLLLPGVVRMKVLRLKQRYVDMDLLHTLHVCLSQCRRLRFPQTKRHAVGIVMLASGFIALFSHQLFFDPLNYNHAPCELFGLTNQCFSFDTGRGWCFMSWYVHLENIGLWIALVFWSIAGFLLVPKKFGGYSFAFFSCLGSVAWFKLLHINFFARSVETFRGFDWAIEWPVLLVCAVISVFGIMMSNEAMIYWENHKKRGNWQKWPGVHQLDIDQAMKNKIFDDLTDDYYRVNKMM